MIQYEPYLYKCFYEEFQVRPVDSLHDQVLFLKDGARYKGIRGDPTNFCYKIVIAYSLNR